MVSSSSSSSSVKCIYDKDHMSELQIKNRSEADLRRKIYEAPLVFEPMTSEIPMRCSTD